MKTVFAALFLVYFLNPLKAQQELKPNVLMAETNVLAFTSMHYDRLIPLDDKFSLMLGGGYLIGTGWGRGDQGLIIQSGLSLFGPANYFEATVLYLFRTDNTGEVDDNFDIPGLKLAYRYQFAGGLSFRISSYLYNADPCVFANIGIGYAF